MITQEETFAGVLKKQGPVVLTDEQKEFYKENGYLIVENGVSDEEIAQLNQETVAICRGERGELRGADLPEDLEGLTDDEVMAKYLAIHFPCRISETVFQYLAHPTIREVLTQIIGPNVKCMQSMLFVKSAGKPGQAWHQDEIYIPTRDRSLAGAWIAMDDATIENGCLWVVPGSHKPGVIWPQEYTEDAEFDCTPETQFPYEDKQGIPVEVPRGSIVFFNGYLLHRSLKNRTEAGYRRVLVNHYMSAESLLPWFSKDNLPTAVGQADNRNIVMIAGEDPYAHKGTEKRAMFAHVRSDGKGGCHDGAKKVPVREPKA